LPEAFALVREAAKRTLNQRHYDVQLIGGIALHRGAIAEMRTGEGKTLCATLPAYLNALTGKGVHIVTVNDYLAKRDGEEMGQVYAYLGLTTGVLNDMNRSYLYDETAVTPENDAVLDQGVSIVPEVLRGVERKEAQEFYDQYKATFSRLMEYLEEVKGYAWEHGHTLTLLGRRREVSLLKSPLPFLRAQGERIAINAPIQGTSADILKLAMIDADAYIVGNKLEDKVKLLLQIHDELIFEIDEDVQDKVASEITSLLEKVLSRRGLSKLPLVVSSSLGPNLKSL
jgi:hypothetical protein